MEDNKQGKQMRFNEQQLSLIKNTYGGKDDMLKLLRKVFLPEVDPTLPIGQMIDLWMTIDIKDKSPEEAQIQMIARNTLISHIEFQLSQLKVLANTGTETEQQVKERLKKDSSK